MESVRKQSHACVHYLVADGMPRGEINDWQVEHITLARAHHNVGNTPRAVGSISAMSEGADAIAYLDADNWYYPHHIAEMIRLHEQTSAAVCSASRTIHRPDGSLMFRDPECNGQTHVDTSCYFLTAAAFRVVPLWGMMPQELGPIGDRVVWNYIQQLGLLRAHNPEPTVAFRTQYAAHYQFNGESPPPDAKANDETTNRALKWWNELPMNERAFWEQRMGFRS